MSASDSWLRRRAHRDRPRVVSPESNEPKPTSGLVSQGARSPGIPRVREKTPDDLIRSYRGDRSVWTRIF